MKTYVLCAILPFLIVSLLPGAPKVCRDCRAEPAQSSYDSYKPPTNVHHRHINRVDIVRSEVLQINPAYFSQYSEGYDSTTQSDILNELKKLGLRSDQIAAMLFALNRTSGPVLAPSAPVTPAPPAPGTAPPAAPAAPTIRPKTEGGGQIGLAVLNAKCAVCHQAGKLAPDQRFTLLDAKGGLATLTALQKLKVITKSYRQEMPPPLNVHGIPSLTDAEFAAIMDLIQ